MYFTSLRIILQVHELITPMSSILHHGFDEQTINQIENLARTTGKPEEVILHDVVRAGLKKYKQTPLSVHLR